MGAWDWVRLARGSQGGELGNHAAVRFCSCFGELGVRGRGDFFYKFHWSCFWT